MIIAASRATEQITETIIATFLLLFFSHNILNLSLSSIEEILINFLLSEIIPFFKE